MRKKCVIFILLIRFHSFILQVVSVTSRAFRVVHPFISSGGEDIDYVNHDFFEKRALIIISKMNSFETGETVEAFGVIDDDGHDMIMVMVMVNGTRNF